MLSWWSILLIYVQILILTICVAVERLLPWWLLSRGRYLGGQYRWSWKFWLSVQEYGIDHLVIPTRDYLFAPSSVDICRAVDFIHRNATCGRTTYVHCKAGRGRSTTIVLCYLVEYKNMTPDVALEYVRLRRPRVLLAPSQWQAVQEHGKRKSEFPAIKNLSPTIFPADAVVVTEADLEGYSTAEYHCKGQRISSRSGSQTRSARLSPVGSLSGDEVIITDSDLEGYGKDEGTCKALSVSSYDIVHPRPMISRLTCLFTALKLPCSCPQVASRLQEIRAC